MRILAHCVQPGLTLSHYHEESTTKLNPLQLSRTLIRLFRQEKHASEGLP